MKKVVLLLMFPIVCFPQFKVKGIVINNEKENLEHVSVAIKDSLKSVAFTTTNAMGEFVIENVKRGKYKLEVYLLGYENESIKIEINENVDLVNIVLVRSKEEVLNDVELISHIPLVQTQGDRLVVNMSNILTKGRTVSQILNYTPFMAVTAKSIKLLGSTPIVLINDRRIYMSGGELVNFLNSIPAEDINSLEIYTNPSARFDAEGSAGVINININKQALIGVKGYIASEVSLLTEDVGGKWGILKETSGNGRISYRDESWYVSTYFKYDRYINPQRYRLITTLEDKGNGYDNSTKASSNFIGKNFQFEIGKDISKDQDIVVNYRYNNGVNEDQSNYINSIFDSNKDVSNVIKGDVKNFVNSDVHMLGVNYNWKINDKGEKIMLTGDYYLTDRKDNQNIKNVYFRPNIEIAERENNILVYLPRKGNIYAFQFDYSKPTEIGKFSFGAKYGVSNIDNRTDYYDVVSGMNIINDERTLDFEYMEGISAVYTEYSRGGLKMGIRYEYTNAIYRDRKLIYNEDKSYGGIFPSISYTYPLFEKRDAITVSYNRRINRPRYSDFNRLDYESENQIAIGTPEIKPSFPNKVQFMYNLMKKYIIIGQFTYTNGEINDISYQSNDSLTVIQRRNIDNFYMLVLAVSVNQSIFDWWSVNFGARVAYNKMNTKFIGINNELIKISGEGFLPHISVGNIFDFYNFNIELNASYTPNGRHGYAEMLSRYRIDLSVRRNFWEDKLSAYLNINDMFGSDKNNFILYSDNMNLKNMERAFTTIDVGLRYNFELGRKNIKEIKSNQGIKEEIERM